MKCDLPQQLEQFETTVENFSKIVSTYYKSLIHDDVPAHLADKLTSDFHNILWSSLFTTSAIKSMVDDDDL